MMMQSAAKKECTPARPVFLPSLGVCDKMSQRKTILSQRNPFNKWFLGWRLGTYNVSFCERPTYADFSL